MRPLKTLALFALTLLIVFCCWYIAVALHRAGLRPKRALHMLGAFFAPLRTYLGPTAALLLALTLAASHGAVYLAGRAGVRAKWDLRIAQDSMEAAKEKLRALEAGQKNTQNAEDFLKAKTDANAKNQNRAATAVRNLAGVLHAAQQCPNQAVPTGATPSGYDGTDPRWQLERGRLGPD